MTEKKKDKDGTKKPSTEKAKPAKPSKKSAADDRNAGSELSGRGFTLSLKGDRSLQAYKDWINGMLLSINPNSKSKDTMTEEEWVKSWKKFWSEADSASTGKKTKATSVGDATEAKETTGTSLEDRYPGITEQIRRFKEADLPPCPHCGSDDTASVQVGVIGRTMNIAGSTRKFKLVMNMSDKQGEYFCNECRKFFD